MLECYTLTITMTEPAGTDFEMCLYDVGNSSAAYTCSQPYKKTCSAMGGQAKNKIVYNVAGGCGIDDNINYFLEVFAASGYSCQPYTFTIGLTGSGPQAGACSF